jgi:hypothetical protein
LELNSESSVQNREEDAPNNGRFSLYVIIDDDEESDSDYENEIFNPSSNVIQRGIHEERE